MLTALRERPLSVDELIEVVQHDGAGAVAVFVGVVRDHNDGREVRKLDYHAYVPMAEKELAAIAAEIEAEIAGVRVACTHRIGELAVGDRAVVCAASSPHRVEALAACRELIERVKARVPIWKREHGPEGPYWVGWEDARCGADHPHPSHAHQHLEKAGR
jgi:molybdopterin synthase catalytic subunit